MKKFAMLAAAVLFAAAPAFAADKWTGTIGDSKCNATHHKAEHGSQDDSDHDCVTKCVDGGNKYVLVTADGKTHAIKNQDFGGLKDHAGHKVVMSGEMHDDVITVSGITMPAPAKGKSK